MLEKYTIGGVDLWLSTPVPNQAVWVGQEEVMEQILACWLVVGKDDLPLCPRLVGKPGLGKTTLAMAAARNLGKDVYIYQCTMDTRPEDLLVTPVLSENGKIRYHASPLVSAMIRGGICILDEGNRMSEKSWASLAPLLDHRRYVESVIAGIKISAHKDFRCTVTMNDDASTYELPDYIMSRVQPMIEIPPPPKEEELAILRYNLPFAPDELLEKTAEFLVQAQGLGMDASPRDGIHMIQYLLKRKEQNPAQDMQKLWKEAIQKILGPEAVDLENLKKQKEEHSLEEFFANQFYKLGERLLSGEDPPWKEDARRYWRGEEEEEVEEEEEEEHWEEEEKRREKGKEEKEKGESSEEEGES